MLTATIATALSAFFDQIRTFLLLWLPPLLLGFLVYLMWRFVKMMPRTAPAELKPESDSIVRWHDVAGVEEAKAELAEIIEFLRDPARFERLGARVPRGVLLHGPPGTGKTLLAKAVAAESGAAFFSQPASAFVEMFAGLGASRIRKLFDTARKHAPAIIFIDELDAVGAARQSAGGFNREQDQTLNQLLVELDGFRRSDVVIMASTNRLDTLDAALLRPGRFDRQVYVSPPDLLAREQILNVHVRNKPIDDAVDLTAIARATAGLTGADLENICNEAAIRATRAGRDTITPIDFDDALERVVAGLKTHRTVSEDEKRMIAYHEAGHALLAHIVGRGMTIHKVTIVPRGGALGYNLYTPTDERILSTRDDLITRIVVLLGGRAGEEVALGEVSNGAGDDLERATAIARAMVFDWGLGESLTTRTVRADNFALSEDTKRQRDQEQSAICDNAYAEAKRLLIENRDALERLAIKLLERETLDREDVATMLHDVQRVGTLAFRLPDEPPSPGMQP
ncbi:MAG: cell division protease FtsH [Gaiellales bacterium]|nr:cell division protease FtsH [Gaiellales bacterium]